MLQIGGTAGIQNDFGRISPSSYEVFPVLTGVVQWSRLRPGSARAIRADLGWDARSLYAVLPTDGRSLLSSSLELYVPGGFRNTSLRISGGAETQQGLAENQPGAFLSQMEFARGYETNEYKTNLVARADYEFPVLYPDLPIGSLFFIQRIRLGVFSDFGYADKAGTPGYTGKQEMWSTGATLIFDFSALNNFPGFNIGVRYSWRWQLDSARVDLMFMDLPLS